MANPQPAKTTKLNALLVGKRTVPSGCKVLNVSQQGMSLQCDPDGRLLTFSSGDAVDIFLSVQHANGHNKFTIPAIVSHVDENLIDVVFHCTDTELAGLIESYRTSESHDLDATIDHRLVSKSGPQAKPVAVNQASVERNKAGRGSTPRGKLSFYTGLLVLFIASLALLGTYNYIYSINKRLNSLEATSRAHTEELAEVQSQVFSSRLQDGRYASLNARMKTLTDAFQSFEIRVSEALLLRTPATDTANQETVDKGTVIEPLDQATDTAGHAVTKKEAATEETVEQLPDTVASKQPEQEVRYITRVELERKPEPKITPKSKYITAKDRPDKTSGAEASGYSTKKYPAIKTSIEAPTAATPTTSVPDTRTVETPANQVIAEVKPTPSGSQVSRVTPATTDESPTGSSAETAAEEQQQQAEQAPTSINRKASTISKPTSPRSLNGPWVINLLSSPSKAYVDKMHAVATDSGIETMIASAEVKGKQYWRLQIPGFESMSAAKRAAEPVKDSLKIQDVWIFKSKP